MATRKTLTIQRGSTLEFGVTVMDDDGNRLNITGWKTTFMVKKSVDDNDEQALLTKILTSYDSPATGETVFTLPAVTTATLPIGVFVYALQIIDTAGNVAESESGTCEVVADVVRATS